MMDIMPKYLLSFQAAIMLKVNAAVSSVKKKNVFLHLKVVIKSFVLLRLPLASLFYPF